MKMTLARCVAAVFLLQLLFLFQASANWRSFYSSPFSSEASGCEYYKNIENVFKCGPDGYPLAYGFSNCIAISRVVGLSPEGALWRDRARSCLQRQLDAERSKSEGPMSCAAIQKAAFQSHPTCYLNPDNTPSEDPSFCDLPPADVAKIFHSIKKGDLLSKDGLQATFKIAEYCAFHHSQKIPRNEAEAELHRQKQSYWENLPRD